jgi:hypothetical protein
MPTAPCRSSSSGHVPTEPSSRPRRTLSTHGSPFIRDGGGRWLPATTREISDSLAVADAQVGGRAGGLGRSCLVELMLRVRHGPGSLGAVSSRHERTHQSPRPSDRRTAPPSYRTSVRTRRTLRKRPQTVKVTVLSSPFGAARHPVSPSLRQRGKGFPRFAAGAGCLGNRRDTDGLSHRRRASASRSGYPKRCLTSQNP